MIWLKLPPLTIAQEMLKFVHDAAQPIIDEFWQQLATETVNPPNKDGETAMLVYFPIHLLIFKITENNETLKMKINLYI